MTPIGKLLRKLNPTLGDRVRADRLTYLSGERMDSVEQRAAEVIDHGVDGMFVEAGVALGGTSIVLADAAQSSGRRFRGYDVFEMIPEPGERDDQKSHERYEVIASGDSNGISGDDYYGYRDDLYGDVLRSFRRYGLVVDGEDIALLQGLFEETMSFEDDDTIALLHVDCDWYEPVKFVLETTYPCLSAGGFILVDDYHDYGGCRNACDEFLEHHDAMSVVTTEHHLVMQKAMPSPER